MATKNPNDPNGIYDRHDEHNGAEDDGIEPVNTSRVSSSLSESLRFATGENVIYW
jgi:hypothetical protein